MGATALPVGQSLSFHSAGAYDFSTSPDTGSGWTSVSTIVTAMSWATSACNRSAVVMVLLASAVCHVRLPSTSAEIAYRSVALRHSTFSRCSPLKPATAAPALVVDQCG